jgi:23S rRNA (pseudouridine1915-N3)-methyltransferase
MILIVAVGQKQPAWVKEAFEDYAKRLPADWAIELKEIKAEPRTTGKTPAAMMAAEAERISATLQKEKSNGSLVTIALDERGKDLTTRQFAELMKEQRSQHSRIAFLIGGPDGLDPGLKTSCPLQIGLSAMTLPHGMARVLLAEQIYRAYSVTTGHPYHRD